MLIYIGKTHFLVRRRQVTNLELVFISSCWQDNEIAGIIKLKVTGEIEFKLNHPILLTGAILILGVFLLIFWRAFKRRTQYTIH